MSWAASVVWMLRYSWETPKQGTQSLIKGGIYNHTELNKAEGILWLIKSHYLLSFLVAFGAQQAFPVGVSWWW